MTRYDICIYVNLIKIQILHTCSIIISAFNYYISRFIKFQKTKLWPSSLYFEKILGQKSAFHICFISNIQYLLDYLTVSYSYNYESQPERNYQTRCCWQALWKSNRRLWREEFQKYVGCKRVYQQTSQGNLKVNPNLWEAFRNYSR